jgi:hypothetical protein
MSNLYEAHIQWRNRPADQRFVSLEMLREAVHQRRLRSRAVDMDLHGKNVSIHGDTIVVNAEDIPCEPTHWSFAQLSSLVRAPAGYLRTLPAPLVVDCLNHGLRATEKQAVKLMTIADPDGQKNALQAVTSPTYGRIWDTDVVDAATRIVQRTGGRFYNPKAYDPTSGKPVPSGLYASDHDVFIFMIDGGSLLDAGPRAQLNRGFFLWNSEVGAKTFGLTTFLFNVVCGNHIVWSASDVTSLIIRHTKNGPLRFDAEATPALLQYANASAAPVEASIRKAQALLIAKSEDEMLTWANQHGTFTRAEVKAAWHAAKKEEGDCRTLWQFIQGVTAYARSFEYVDARVDLETRAGQLLKLVSAS